MRDIYSLLVLIVLLSPAAAQIDKATADLPWTCAHIGSASIVGGKGYSPGIYDNVSLSGGSGHDATARITVSPEGTVVDVTIINWGQGYKIMDQLSAPLLGGTGFILSITEVRNTHPALTLLKDQPKPMKLWRSLHPDNCSKN